MQTATHTIERSNQKLHKWLKEIEQVLEFTDEDPRDALTVLRCVLHELRDNLPIEHQAKFSQQLPIIIRGLFFENWQPSKTPVKHRHSDEFLSSISRQLEQYQHPYVNPKSAVLAVAKAIAGHISLGEFSKLLTIVPKDISLLFLQGL